MTHEEHVHVKSLEAALADKSRWLDETEKEVARLRRRRNQLKAQCEKHLRDLKTCDVIATGSMSYILDDDDFPYVAVKNVAQLRLLLDESRAENKKREDEAKKAAVMPKFYFDPKDCSFEDLQVPRPPLSGADMVLAERSEQIYKHGCTVERDFRYRQGELLEAAVSLIRNNPKEWPLKECNPFLKKKSRVEMLAIAGAFVCAEIDRIEYEGILKDSAEPKEDDDRDYYRLLAANLENLIHSRFQYYEKKISCDESLSTALISEATYRTLDNIKDLTRQEVNAILKKRG